MTSRSAYEIPFPDIIRKGQWSSRATARNSAGKLLNEKMWMIRSKHDGSPPLGAPASLPGNSKKLKLASKDAGAPGLQAWPTLPYGAFEESRLAPLAREHVPGKTNQVSLDSLYLDEADQGAFIVALSRDETTQGRITLARPARKDGVTFGGTIVLREVIPTGSVNGEQVPDALPALDDAGVVTLLPHRSLKLWVSVDSHGAEPGDYSGTIIIASLSPAAAAVQLPLHIEVLDLRLPNKFSLKLCTWDYVPNRWFQSRTKEVLDDMGRHGVNLFPRSTIPAARVDAAGALTINWTTLDAELTRLEHRGQILFHLNHPPIEAAIGVTPEEKRAFELQYIRALRDHLREHGFDYPDYAFYLLDEPGLDYGTNVPVLLDAGKLFREADPRLLTYTDPVPGLSWKDFERIEPLVDVWAPNMRLVSGLLSGDPRIKRIMNASNVWSYECVGQVKSLSPLRYNRANAWRARFFGLSGIGFWTHSTTEADLWFPGKTSEEEYALVYPGALPVPSARWEAVRDGLEDVAAITLLERQIRRHREAGTQGELVREAEEKLRIALRDIMELSDEAFVESRDFLRQGDRVLGHTWTDVELFRRHRAEIARLTLALSSTN